MTKHHFQAGPFELSGLRWIQADVFSRVALAGNGLAVFPDAEGLTSEVMLRLTQELRQFEAIFLNRRPDDDWDTDRISARIFTAEEELDFAGHPVLGAASVLQHLAGEIGERTWRFDLTSQTVAVRTQRRPFGFWAEMDQGTAVFGSEISDAAAEAVVAGLGLTPGMLFRDLPVAMASTGLPYVIVPVTAEGLSKARIDCLDFEQRLARLGGKFVYVLDPIAREGRSWDNAGLVEDIATGSAAGPAAAYLWHYYDAPDSLIIQQGRFLGRPSEIAVTRDSGSGSVLVSGDVVILAEGIFR